MSLPLWVEIFLLIYFYIKAFCFFEIIGYIARGEKVCQTPSDFRVYFDVNKSVAIFMFVLFVLLFPIYNLVLGIVRLIERVSI